MIVTDRGCTAAVASSRNHHGAMLLPVEWPFSASSPAHKASSGLSPFVNLWHRVPAKRMHSDSRDRIDAEFVFQRQTAATEITNGVCPLSGNPSEKTGSRIQGRAFRHREHRKHLNRMAAKHSPPMQSIRGLNGH